MSNYSTGELAKLCNVTTRTIQYYDRKGILKPQGFTEGKRRVYTEQQRQTLELILLLKDLGCALSDIDMLLKGEGTLKTLNTLLTMKQQEINQQVKQQQAVLNKIKNVQYYVNEASTSPITHLKDIEHVMSKSAEMKSIRRNIWISAGIIGIIQYSSIMSSILMKNKWPFLIALPFMNCYGIGVTFITNKRLPIYVLTASIYSHHLCGQLSKRNIQRQHVDSNVRTVMKRIIALKYLKRI